MGRRKYVIGIDFGTESGRTLLVDVASGAEIASAIYHYKNGVIDRVLPGSHIKLDHNWALQDPADYIRTLENVVPSVIKKARVKADDIIGIGIDFTICTMMPIKSDGTPLCQLKAYRSNPHSWVKLWKHHAAQPEADAIINLAQKRREKFLQLYGGRVSSEWFFPKILQILNEAPKIYQATDRFIQAADWLVMQLTGRFRKSACTAGYKEMWNRKSGYPSISFLKSLHPKLGNVVQEKIGTDIYPIGTKAGKLTGAMAKRMGLNPGIAVATAIGDAHAAVLAAGVTEPGKMVIILGTSNCHMILSPHEYFIQGVAGVVRDGIVPGYYGYEAGQSGTGDILAWFVRNCVPAVYEMQANRYKQDIYSYLQDKAAQVKPGKSGLLALDWWNGNRSILMDADLSGLLLGMTLATRSEDIFRAIMESIAFGTLKIIETFESGKISVKQIYACGGLAEKNPVFMQMLADVVNRPIKLVKSEQACALGAAILGAVAAGKMVGGYDSIHQAARMMGHTKNKIYMPVRRNVLIYKQLYSEYIKLHDYLGITNNRIMKNLKQLRD